jgi:hypothetical protein
MPTLSGLESRGSIGTSHYSLWRILSTVNQSLSGLWDKLIKSHESVESQDLYASHAIEYSMVHNTLKTLVFPQSDAANSITLIQNSPNCHLHSPMIVVSFANTIIPWGLLGSSYLSLISHRLISTRPRTGGVDSSFIIS